MLTSDLVFPSRADSEGDVLCCYFTVVASFWLFSAHLYHPVVLVVLVVPIAPVVLLFVPVVLLLPILCRNVDMYK